VEVNALRAHLQEALAQRAESVNAGDWAYSDAEVAAMRAELEQRPLALLERQWTPPQRSPAAAIRRTQRLP
jgi:hypothetical protein